MHAGRKETNLTQEQSKHRDIKEKKKKKSKPLLGEKKKNTAGLQISAATTRSTEELVGASERLE